MKLYEVERRTLIDCEGTQLRFYHIDGAYSYCMLVGADDVVHLRANAPVTIIRPLTEDE